jgi:membrane protease YdiL (CAAX protease family)
MNSHPLNRPAKQRSLLTFFLLVFVFSVPFWVLGPLVERLLPGALPIDLPLSSLMTFCPLLAAVVLARMEQGAAGVKMLLKRAFDARRIKRKIWYLPIFLLMPAMVVLQLGVARLAQETLPDLQVPILALPVSLAVFFVAALGEEVGWLGVAIDRMRHRWNALGAAMMLGLVWALWHVIPMTQMDRTPTWIAWQFLNLLVSRILYVWVYYASGRSVSAVILLHAMHNLSTVLLPSYGWPYEPMVAAVILAAAAVIVTFLWGPQTLARYRYVRRGGDAHLATVS